MSGRPPNPSDSGPPADPTCIRTRRLVHSFRADRVEDRAPLAESADGSRFRPRRPRTRRGRARPRAAAAVPGVRASGPVVPGLRGHARRPAPRRATARRDARHDRQPTARAARRGARRERGGRAGRRHPVGQASHGVSVPPVFALTRYRGPPRAAIIAGKERNRRDLPPVLGAALGAGLPRLLRAGVIAPPDASGPLAGARAESAGRRASPGRRPRDRDGRGGRARPGRRGAADGRRSVPAHRGRPSTRWASTRRAASPTSPAGSVSGRRVRPRPAPGVVLVDDVLTTGATVASRRCACWLRAGPGQCSAGRRLRRAPAFGARLIRSLAALALAEGPG